MGILKYFVSRITQTYTFNMSAAAAAAPKAKKAAKPKVPAAHPPYANMVAAAIKALKERNGSSRQAILKYIVANYKVGDAAKAQVRVRLALKKMAAAKTEKKPAVKKPKAKKAAKKPAAKKAAKPKKPAAKKAAKKPAAKKAAPKKKPAAKKPAAKKAAPKKK